MPTGPLGLPRLTTFGPLVKPDDIKPAYSLDEGIYPFDAMVDYTPETAEMVKINAIEIGRMEPGFEELSMDMTDWRYHKMPVEQLIDGNSFAKAIIEIMGNLEDKYGKLFPDPSGDYAGDEVANEITSLAEGRESVLDEDTLEMASSSYSEYMRDEDPQLLRETIDKVENDITRAVNIANSIEESGEYWPAAVEKDADENSGMFFGTIDGSHRVIAYSQILEEGDEVYVWEWVNEDEFRV